MKRWSLVIILCSGLLVYALFTAMLPVNEGSYAIVFQFGKVVHVIDSPGLHWKWPEPFQTRLVLNKKMLLCDPAAREFLTDDKKNIVADYFFTYQITDPLQFHKTLKDLTIAEVTLEDLVTSAFGSIFGQYLLSSLISTDLEANRLDEMLQAVLHKGNENLSNTGVRIQDVAIKRLTFPKDNEKSIFARMYSERQRIATRYRAEGMEVSRKIKATAKLEAEKIKAQAHHEAEVIRGNAEAEAIAIFAKTFEKDPEMYEYIRRLQIYKDVIGENDILVLPGDLSFNNNLVPISEIPGLLNE
jgi:membrane protease subunit HflC